MRPTTTEAAKEGSHSVAPLASARRDDHRVRAVERVELRGVHVLDREALQERRRREDVAVVLDEDVVAAEACLEQPSERERREGPEPRAGPLTAIDLADPGRG